MHAFCGENMRGEKEKKNGRGCSPKGQNVLGPLSGGFISFSQEGILRGCQGSFSAEYSSVFLGALLQGHGFHRLVNVRTRGSHDFMHHDA